MLIQTSATDHNYFSLANNLTNLTGVAGALFSNPPVFEPATPQSYDAILKLSDGTHDLNLTNVKVAQGMEAAVDINNRVFNISLQGEFGTVGATGDQVITVKGGSHDIKFAGTMNSRGTSWDIRLGDWSDQCHDKSYNVNLSALKHADGGKIRVVVGHAAKPNLGPNCQILFWRSLGEKIYWWLKLALVKIVEKFPALAKPLGFTLK